MLNKNTCPSDSEQTVGMWQSLFDENDCVGTHSRLETELNTEFNLRFNLCYNEKKMFLKVKWQHVKDWSPCSPHRCEKHARGKKILGFMAIFTPLPMQRQFAMQYHRYDGEVVGGCIILHSVEVINHSLCTFPPLLWMLHGFQVCAWRLPWMTITHTKNVTLWMSLATWAWNGKSKICWKFTTLWLAEAMDEAFGNFD